MPAWVAVGLDSSDAYHDIHAAAPGGPTVLRFRIPNDLLGFQELLTRLRDAFGELPGRFGLENPTSLLARFLLHAGQAVYPINPRCVAQVRAGLSSSGKKDDPLDAEAICLLLLQRGDTLSPLRSGSADSWLLTGLVRQRVDVVEELNRVHNQLKAALKSYYPRALQLFPKLDQPLSRRFLQTFGSPTALAQATRAAWDALFVGQRYPRPGRIPTLWERAQQPQVPVSPEAEALGAGLVRRLLCRFELLLAERDALEAEIQERFQQLPDAPTFRSLPGAGDVLAPELFALLGDDRDRWSDWQAVGRTSGVVPVTRQSGRTRTVRMRGHCDRRARRALYLFAGCSRQSCEWAAEFYRKQRAAGKSHATALRNLAAKWLRILFRMWQDRTPYDAERYRQRCAERQAPRVADAAA